MKVVVVGAGYAGTFAANRAAGKLAGAQVTVVNPRPDFVERVRLHQRIARTAVAATPLSSMLRRGVVARLGSVEGARDGSVTLDDGERLAFDHLFLAVGSTVRPLAGTVPVGTWEGAERARAALAALPGGSTVTVVGGGATGVETATEVAEARPDVRVRLVAESVGEGFTGGARRRVLAALHAFGVTVVEDSVEEVTAEPGRFDGVLHLRSGAAAASDLTLWAIVADVPDLAARSGLDVDPRGRVVVDAFLRSVTDGRISAVGDCAAVPGARFGCQTAGAQARAAVDAVARLREGRAPEPYTPRYAGRCVSLGRSDALVQFTHRDDTLRRSYLAGRGAVVAKGIAVNGAKYGSRRAISV